MKGKIILMFVASSLLFQAGLCQNIPGDRKPIPGGEKIYLAELKTSRPGIERIESLLKLSVYYTYFSHFRKKDFDLALNYGWQARKFSDSLSYEDGINEARLSIAGGYILSGQDSIGRLMLDSVFTNVEAISKNASQPERQIRALRQLANLYELRQDYDLAEGAFVEIIKIIESSDFSNAHYTYERLARINYEMEKYDKALSYGLQALKLMTMTNDSTCAGFIYATLAQVYVRVGQFEKSVDYGDAALNFFQGFGGSTYLSDILECKALAMQKLKKHKEVISLVKTFSKMYPPVTAYDSETLVLIQGNTYRMTKEYALAEPFILQSFALGYKGRAKGAAYKATGQFYAEWCKFDKARPYLESALKLLPPNSHLHFLMYMVDSAQGNYNSAMRHLLINKKLDDSAYYVTKAKALQEMQVKYETEVKDKDLALLKQESLFQQAQVEQAETTRKMFIAGTVMLFLLLVLIYNRYQLKQQANKEMIKKNLTLEHLVKEKEWLLKEVHHRVKNNLQTVLSLLESQSRKLSDEALDAIQESQNRVYAMSLIHKKLYQSNDVSSIDMEDYLRDLVQHLRDSFGTSANIRFSLQLDSVDLDVSQVVPIGLIVNEAVTNSIKYAFPNRHHDNEINITLARVYGDRILLVISDNGAGIHEPTLSTESLGVKLMRGLTEDIEGTFIIESKAGVTIRIEFAATKPFQRPTETVAQAFAHQPALQ